MSKSWFTTYGLVLEYIAATNGLPASTTVWGGTRIGEWLMVQHRRAMRGELPQDQLAALYKVPHLFPNERSMLPRQGVPYPQVSGRHVGVRAHPKPVGPGSVMPVKLAPAQSPPTPLRPKRYRRRQQPTPVAVAVPDVPSVPEPAPTDTALRTPATAARLDAGDVTVDDLDDFGDESAAQCALDDFDDGATPPESDTEPEVWDATNDDQGTEVSVVDPLAALAEDILDAVDNGEADTQDPLESEAPEPKEELTMVGTTPEAKAQKGRAVGKKTLPGGEISQTDSLADAISRFDETEIAARDISCQVLVALPDWKQAFPFLSRDGVEQYGDGGTSVLLRVPVHVTAEQFIELTGMLGKNDRVTNLKVVRGSR